MMNIMTSIAATLTAFSLCASIKRAKEDKKRVEELKTMQKKLELERAKTQQVLKKKESELRKMTDEILNKAQQTDMTEDEFSKLEKALNSVLERYEKN